MKRLSVILLFCLSLICGNLHGYANAPEKERVYEAVEQRAEFPGGSSALSRWLAANLMYPTQAQENGIQGRVIVKFVIEKDGSITNVSVARGVDSSLDAEAVRIVKKMPKWKVARNNGVAVRSYYILPIDFKLQN